MDSSSLTRRGFIGAALAVAACGESPVGPTFSAPVGKTVLGTKVWDNFHRSDRNLDGDTLPTGQLYDYQGKQQAVIRNNAFVVDPSAPLVGAYRAALLVPLGTAPNLVVADYSFSQGASARQNVVVGSSGGHLAQGSIQLGVWPSATGNGKSWELFRVSVVNGTSDYYRFASGIMPDLEYGRVYRSTIFHDGPKVTCVLPNGESVTVTHDDIDTFWLTYPFVQIRLQSAPTDGQAKVLTFAAST